jgi:hypothetical protein
METKPPDAPPAPPAVDPNLLVFKESSNIRQARFDAKTGVVEVQFQAGPPYRYQNFTAALMEDWRAARSAGGWFHANVKNHPEVYPLLKDGETPKPAATTPPGVPQPPTPPAEKQAAFKMAPGPIVKVQPPTQSETPTNHPWKSRPWRGPGNGCTTPAKVS